MAIATAAVTVATTATALATADVTTANGLPLGGGISFDVPAGEAFYAIVASGTVAVRVLEHGI